MTPKPYRIKRQKAPRKVARSLAAQPDLFVWRFCHDLQAARARRILDAGCGAGRNAAYLATQGFEVVALDWAANKVGEARGSASQANISFITGRLESLPFSSGAFDAVVCTHVMEYLDSPGIRATLEECRRVLQKDGLLLLVTAAKDSDAVEAAEDMGKNDYLFRQGSVAVPIHLADRQDLESWLRGFRVREILRLSVEYPRAATVSGSWAVVAAMR